MAKNNETNVYVVTEHYEWEMDNGETHVVGVFATKELAEKAMKVAYNAEIDSWLDDVVNDLDEVEQNEFDNYCSLFNLNNNIDYYLVEITETPLCTE